MRPSILVTAFGPFGATTNNPSAALAEFAGVPYRVLEVSYAAVDAWLDSGEADRYEVLLHLGFAARSHMTPELFAHNRIGETPDVRGVARAGVIDTDGPEILGSTLWTLPVLAELVAGGNVDVSLSAGAYLCNYIGYRTLCRYPEKRIGFLHVPAFEVVPQQAQSQIVARILASV